MKVWKIKYKRDRSAGKQTFHRWRVVERFILSGKETQINSLPPDPHLTLHPSPPGCLDRLFICPSWARRGYCDSKRGLMKKHCPSSCDFCYGKIQQQQKKKKRVSAARSCCGTFAIGATGANRSSIAALQWGFSRIRFSERLLAAGRAVFTSGGHRKPPGRGGIYLCSKYW